jgi:hypothetical protein
MSAASRVAVYTSFVIALCVSAQVRAGTLPDISGRWYANGNSGAVCHITQSGTSVSLVNQNGVRATGNFDSPSTLSTDWGVFNGGRITGTISGNLRRINWSNGSYWTRANPAPIGPAPAPARTPTPKPTPTPVPLRINTRISDNHSNPVYIFAASLTNGSQPFTYQQCVSFRNITTKVVTEVEFQFVVTDYRGDVEANFDWLDKGTFTPPVNIDNHCSRGWLWPAHVVRRMTNETVHVRQVTFADDTVWKPGDQFLRGHSSRGTPLPQPTMQTHTSAPAETPTPNPEQTPK